MPRPNSHHKGDLFNPEGQRQETEEGGERGQRRREDRCLSQREKELPLVREKTDVVYRQMAVYKGKKENPVLG